MEKITIHRFGKICLFCLSDSKELKIISDVPSVNIFKIISGIENTELLPQKICSLCELVFKTFSNFIEKSKDNINSLLRIYEKSKQKQKLNTNISDNEIWCDDNCDNFDEECPVKENRTGAARTSIPVRPRRKSKRNIASKCHGSHGSSEDLSLKCEKCQEKFPSETSLAEHARMENCFLVEFKVKPESGLMGAGHRKLKSSTKTFACKKCKRIFNTREDLDDHKKDVFDCEPFEYKCLECNKLFKKQHRLNNHMRSHKKDAPFQCTECGKTFKFQQNLKRHMLIHKGIKKYKCDDCGKAFSRAHVLNEHRNIHTGHNPYICAYCGKGFKRYANHFIHVYRHKLLNGEIDQTKEKKLYLQLQCNICDKIFASRGGLENHLTLHQEEPRHKNFLCNECGKGFMTNTQLESHRRMHTNERPYECNLCGKKFKQKSTYSNHQLVHTGEKPYQCTECERLFTQSGHLKVHMRVHSGEKPYSCNFCGKKFALGSNLKVHTRTHTGEKPYVCSVCGKGYCDSTSLKKHFKSHGDLPSHGNTEFESEALDLQDCPEVDHENKDVGAERIGS